MPIPDPITIARRLESMIDLSHGPIPRLKDKQREPAHIAQPMRWGRCGSPNAESWSEERLQWSLKSGFKSWLLCSLARSPGTRLFLLSVCFRFHICNMGIIIAPTYEAPGNKKLNKYN